MNSKQTRLKVCNAMFGVLLALLWVSVATASDVVPVLISGYQSGDAQFECQTYGCGGDFAYKFDEWDGTEDGAYQVDGPTTITISNNDGATFDWASEWPVCTVIVKAGTQALVYSYPGGSYGDTGLRAPEKNSEQDNDGDGLVNEDPIDGNDNDSDGLIDEDSATTGEGRAISHATFCYNESEACWEEETAWAAGNRYVRRGNWAMYSSAEDLASEDGVPLIADGGSCPTVIGTATLEDNGDGTVTINIVLDGAIFYYDVNDPLFDDNLKVQDYDVAPSKTPAPGTFDWKVHIEPGATTGSITVPAADYYGVHLDVALPCGHCL